jgi:hypothetical protein
MSDARIFTHTEHETESQSSSDKVRVISNTVAASTGQSDGTMTNAAAVQLHEDTNLALNKEVSELMVRRLTKEIDEAKGELQSLETTLVYDLFTPSVREWLLPLMAIGLALSLYGSFTSSNSAELGATGMMLLWSLSAFWLIYTRDKRLELAKRANKAEIEIWSSRIDELQESLERNKRVVEAAGE